MESSDTTLRPDGSIVIDDSSTKSHWADPPKKKASLHLLKISGTDAASREKDVIAMFTSLMGHPPSEEILAQLRAENAKISDEDEK